MSELDEQLDMADAADGVQPFGTSPFPPIGDYGFAGGVPRLTRGSACRTRLNLTPARISTMPGPRG